MNNTSNYQRGGGRPKLCFRQFAKERRWLPWVSYLFAGLGRAEERLPAEPLPLLETVPAFTRPHCRTPLISAFSQICLSAAEIHIPSVQKVYMDAIRSFLGARRSQPVRLSGMGIMGRCLWLQRRVPGLKYPCSLWMSENPLNFAISPWACDRIGGELHG